MHKSFWLAADSGDWREIKGKVTDAIESGVDVILVSPQNIENVRSLGDVTIATRLDEETVAEEDVIVVSEDLEKLKSIRSEGMSTAAYVVIEDKTDENLALQAAKYVDFVVIVGKDWKVIPLENLIAMLHKEPVEIIAAVSNSEDAKVALETLELGADGVMLDSEDTEEIRGTSEVVRRSATEKLELRTAKVTNKKVVGMGNRVCVDTCSFFKKGEGILIGSQSSGLFLIHSETLENPYAETRPFRVNAGPIHAYVRIPGGETKYLSELRAGEEVSTVDSEGNTRSAVVGRSKIEKRPLILVEAECEGMRISTIVQNAETIRFVDTKGDAISVAKLKEGDEILVQLEEKGRHFGMAVEETIIEK